MPTTKEQAELDYMAARMGRTSLSEEPSPSSPAPDPTQSEAETQLDESISAEQALAHKESGNALYKSGDYKGAIAKYTLAASSAHSPPEARAIALANRAAAQLKLQRFRETADDASEALTLKPGYVKALLRRKEARVALKEFRGACEDAKELGKSQGEIGRLERLAQEKEKKDRDEALESLKGLGNAFLSNFGMSMDDLNMQQDPETGSYSINVQR